jgi:hypothetical protein
MLLVWQLSLKKGKKSKKNIIFFLLSLQGVLLHRARALRRLHRALAVV